MKQYLTTRLQKDFSKIYHQQGVNLNDSGENIDIIFGEKIYQIGNAYLQIEIKLKKYRGKFEDDNTNTIRLVNNAPRHLFKEATISTTGGTEIEVNKICRTCF